MALLKIIKLSNKTWKHNSDVDGDFILTKFYAKQEDNNFLLIESYGSKRRKYLINEIEVYNVGGSVETFANFSTLFLRLEALSYPAFYEDGVFIFNPNEYISSDSGNTLVLGTDNNFFVPSSVGAETFTDLTDTPSTYTGQAGKVPTVNSAEDALEFTEVSGGTPLIFSDTTMYTHTGTTTSTALGTFTIPADTIKDGDVWEIDMVGSRQSTNNSSAASLAVYMQGASDESSFADSSIRFLPIGVGALRRVRVTRSYLFKGGNIHRFSNAGGFYHDYQSIQNNKIASFDLSIPQDITYGMALTSSTDVAVLDYIIFKKIN